MEATCPNCQAKGEEVVLYKCIRCYTVYCQKCEDTQQGHYCPKCRMSLRMVLSP